MKLLLIPKAGLWVTLFAAICSTSTSNASAVSAGNKSVLYASVEGDLFSWGANSSGQLGDGTVMDRSSPVISLEAGPWLAVSASLTPPDSVDEAGHSLAIKTNGTLWAWGANSRGQLGLGDTVDRNSPTQVGSSSDWIAVEAGSSFSMALNSLGEIWLWGDNSFNQLGPGVGSSFLSVPRRLADKDGSTGYNDTYIAIAAGANHALALHATSLSDGFGRIYAWGGNSRGQLGLGHTSTSVGSPSLQPGPTLWKFIEAGIDSSFSITVSGNLFAWGAGPFGGLGIGGNQGTSIQQASSPTQTINSLSSGMVYESVSAGSSHTLALADGGGSVYATGQNASGQLGISGLTLRNTFQLIPLDIPAGISVEQVGAGRGFSIVVFDDGRVLSAGSNDRGQLGNGTTNASGNFSSTALGTVDLSVDSVNLVSNAEDVSPGESVVFDIIVRNEGTGTVEAGTGGAIRIALSPQAVFNSEGELDFDGPVTLPLSGTIRPGAAVSVRVNATLPDVIPTGDYRILVDLDTNDELEESDESNNFGATETPDDLLEFRADLQVDLVDANLPGSIQAGDSFEVDVDFINNGNGSLIDGAGNGFEYRLILSDSGDPFVGANFELIIDETFSEFPFESGLSAGAAPERRTVRVTVPENVMLADYSVGVIVDSTERIEELDETNNIDFSASGSFTVTGLSIREALDLPEPPADNPGTPEIDESVPVALFSGGDASWFGKVDAGAIDGDSLSSPSLEAGQFASLTFEFDEPREVSFRWKAATSSSQNRLFFGANRVPLKPESQSAPESLSGQRDWSEVSFIVPTNTPVGFFYEQAVAGDGDQVFVDDLRVTSPAVDKPDYVVDNIQFDAGSYMLRRDRLTVTVDGLNRGADFDLPDDFAVSVWLSRDTEAGDADDVLLGDLNAFQVLNNGAEFVYRASFELPDSLADADYFVLARVDSGNVVEEFNEAAPFSDTDNNFAFSSEAGVSITRAADLRVTRLVSDSELPIFVGGPVDLYPESFDPEVGQGEQTVFGTFLVEPLSGEKSELQIRFDVLNEGLSPVEAQDYTIRIFMAPNRETSLQDATTLFEFVETDGLAIGGGKTFEVTTSIPEEVEPGRFYYVGVQVDALEEVPESDEVDNITRSEENNVFVGEVPLEVALNDSLNDPSLREWKDGFPGTLDNIISDSPWFGQSRTVQRDSATSAAAQSGPVPIAGQSVMETEITINSNARLISFFWKVSSQLDPETGQADTLTFSASKDGGAFEVIAGPIAGEADWSKVEHIFQPGNYTLRWTYQESGDDVRNGADAGWVDNFSASAPDFEPINLEVFASDSVVPGDDITVSFDLLNSGDGTFSSVLTQIRLVPETGTPATLDWSTSDAGDVVLMPSTRTDLGAFSRTFTIPESLSQGGEFVVGVWVDDALAIQESNESNNLKFLEGQKLSIEVPVSIDQALDTNANPWVSDGREWQLGGNSPWFASQGEASEPDDFLTVPAMFEGETAVLERIIEGPVILRFDWRENSVEGSNNRIFFEMNGVSAFRDFDAVGADLEAGTLFSIGAEGEAFVTESVLIPAGLQSVRFRYEVGDQGGAAERSAAINNMEIIDIPSADVEGEADFAIRDVTFNPDGTGPENAQVYALERDRLPLEILAVNRGATPAGLVPSDTQIEVSLSSDQNFDSGDSIVGNLAPTQTLDGGRRLFYSGDLDLPLNLEPGKYFLILRMRALDGGFEEITLDGSELLVNNDFVSEFDSIEIVRLPQLVVRATQVENQKVFFPKEDVRFAWELENIGLGDIPAESGLTQTVELWAFAPGTTEFTFGNAEKVLDVAEVVEDGALNGRLTAENSLQSTISYNQTFKLPAQARLLEALGIGDVTANSEDLSPEVLLSLSELEGYEFFFVLQRDAALEQSSNLAITALTSSRFVVSAFSYSGEVNPSLPTLVDYELWGDFQRTRLSSVDDGIRDLTLPSGELTNTLPGTGGDSGIPNFYYYAFNLPLVSDLSDSAYGLQVNSEVVAFKNNRIANVEGDERMEVTFPIVRGAVDVRYVVQKEVGPGAWAEFYTITPPFLDEKFGFVGGFVGNQSLTAVDTGLLSEPEVVAVVDNNYSATVTVRGDDEAPLRVVLLPTNLEPLQQFVLNGFAARGEIDLRRQGADEDFDDDGVSNIAELQLGADPTDASSGGTISDLEAQVAERFAFDFGVFGLPAPADLGPFADRDGDGTSNLAEMQLGFDPTNPDEAPADSLSPTSIFIAESFAQQGIFNAMGDNIFAASLNKSSDFDGDGESNLMELALGGDMALAGVTKVPVQVNMDGTDCVITYVRLKASLQPDGLSILVECTDNMSEAWEQVSDVGSTESLSTDQSGIAEGLERVELRVDTTQSDCNFFRIRVEDLLD